jgi:hypothetical protein
MAQDSEITGAYGHMFTVDLLGPATAINPPGAEGDMGKDPATGWLTAAHNATQVCFQSYQLPHGFVENHSGGTLGRFEPHVHWQKSTSASGTVAFRLRYRWANIGSVWTDWSDPITVTTPAVSDRDTAGVHALTSFGPIILPNAKISAGILCEVARVGSEGTYGASIFITDIDAHVTVNSPGSVQLYTKYRGGELSFS